MKVFDGICKGRCFIIFSFVILVAARYMSAQTCAPAIQSQSEYNSCCVNDGENPMYTNSLVMTFDAPGGSTGGSPDGFTIAPISVTSDQSCGTWTATASAPWIAITAPATGSGNGTINYSVAPNGGQPPLTGTITFNWPAAPQGPTTLNYTIYQAGTLTTTVPATYLVDYRYNASGESATNPNPLLGDNSATQLVGSGPYVLSVAPGTYTVQINALGPDGGGAVVWVGPPDGSSGKVYQIGSGLVGASVTVIVPQGQVLVLYFDDWSDSDNDPDQWDEVMVTSVGPTITTPSLLPSGMVNVFYSQTLAATGGNPPYSNWVIVPGSGALPQGFSLDPIAGTISGMTSAFGLYTFSITVNDNSGTTSPPVAFSLTISPPPIMISSPTSPQLPSGTATAVYTQVTFMATGGTGVYTWSQTGLPPGLSLNASTGVLSGTPASGTQSSTAYPVTVSVTDSNGDPAASGSYTLTINAPPAIISLNPGSTTANGPAFTLTVTGSNFTLGAAVNWNGAALTTTFVNSAQLSAQVPASLIATTSSVPLTANITVSGAGATSNTVPFTINPQPVVSSLNPIGITATGPTFTLTVNGSNFISGATVNWNGSAVTTTFVSATQLSAQVPASLIANAGTANITVSEQGATSSLPPAIFNITPPPAIISLNPGATTANGPAFTLTVNGSNFISGAAVNWNGSALSTTFVSSTQLSAQVPASLIATTGTAPVMANVAVSEQGVTSNTLPFTTATIAIGSLNPTSATVDGPAFTLTVTGTGFTSGAAVNWNGAALTTSFESATQLSAQVPASFIATVGPANITVSESGVTSNAVTFTVTSPPPVISSLTPSNTVAGGPPFTLTVTGTGFISGATVNWNGSALTTTFGSATQLGAQVPASLIATGGTPSSVTVSETGAISNALPFTINPPPVISSLNPGSIAAGGLAFTLTVTGSGFISGAVVNWNGTSLTTTFGSATQLSAQVPASFIASVGTSKVTVSEQGATSTGVSFVIGAPPLVISALTPSSAVAGGLAFTLTVTGSGFTSGAVVNWNGSVLATTFGNSTQLSAQVPASLIASVGTANVTVSESGAISKPMTFTIGSATVFTSPQSLSFSYVQGGSVPVPQTFSVFSSGASVKYSVAASENWLQAVATAGQTPDNVTVSLQNLTSLPACSGSAPCSNTATVKITPVGGSATAPTPVNITLTVIPAQPQLSVSPQYPTITSVTGGSSVQQQVQVSNTGGGTLSYSVTTPTNPPWLTVSCGTAGQVTLSTPASVCLTLNPPAQTGLYHAPVVIDAGGTPGSPFTVNVTLQVTQAAPSISLSPDAMTFTAVSGGQTPASQTLNVFNVGTGGMSWTAQSSTAPWLQLSNSADCAGAGATVQGTAQSGGVAGAGFAMVCVDPAQAKAGDNYGQIALTVPDGSAANSPQVITVLLKVLPAGSSLPEVALPTGVTLLATAGSNAPPAVVECTNPNADAVGFSIISALEEGSEWLSTNVTNGSLPGKTMGPLNVQGSAAKLIEGTYQGQVRIAFADGTTPVINVVLDVSAASGTTSMTESARPRGSTNCLGASGQGLSYTNPPLFLNQAPPPSQVQAGGGPISIYASELDNCNNPITGTTSGITFKFEVKACPTYSACGDLEGGPHQMSWDQVDPSLQGTIGNNAWHYSWTPLESEVGPVYLFLGVDYGNATLVGGGTSAAWPVSVTAAAAGAPPEPDGTTNGASVALDGITQINQVAAGSYLYLGGTSLADGTDANPAFPYPMQDQGTQVFLGGKQLLMTYVSPSQVNALVPSNLPLGTQQLTVMRDGLPSVINLQVPVASAQPAIFTLPSSSSPPQGAVLINSTYAIAAPAGSIWPGSTPAKAGVDYIQIYCNGLGPVSNSPVYGAQALGGLNLSETPTTPVVTIGGMPATVVFSGLAPGLVAVYQVNALVPAGVTAGDAVPVILQMLGSTANTVTIAVQ